MRNIALLIEYDGTAYGGWQVQKNSDSIQGTIEETLSRLLQEKVKLVGAGRTDAGVHARGQVANFRTHSEWEPAKLKHALNGTLPEDIAVLTAAEVSPDFHARYSAIARRYSYRIVQGKTAIGRTYSSFFPFELSVDAMNLAASGLLGEKNFRSFSKYAAEQRSFICNVTNAEWRTENGERKTETVFRVPCSVLRFEIEANRFLHGMVRAIVGTLIDVGRGKITVEDFHRIVMSEDRTKASMSAPASGLCLEEVKYGFDVWRDGR
jgi:tRNA pseudouridine38-40 synthase